MLRTCLGLAILASTGCGSDRQTVDKANEAGRSWAATVRVVAEQWAQSRVSLRFSRTTLQTALEDLARRADSVRPVDPVAATRLDRLQQAISPVMSAVVSNEPDRAREAAAGLPQLLK